MPTGSPREGSLSLSLSLLGLMEEGPLDEVDGGCDAMLKEEAEEEEEEEEEKETEEKEEGFDRCVASPSSLR